MASSGTIVSLISWLIIPAIPVGAWIAERIGRPVPTMITSFIVIAVLISVIPFTSSYFMLFIVIGIAFGPAAGLIMALPSKVLRAENRAIGMGIFFTLYYLGMGLSAAIAGYFRDVTNNPASPLYIASGTILLAGVALLTFIRLQHNHENGISVDGISATPEKAVCSHETAK
jgi:predicted MFS family arabinose efflux permease